jgi:hypothetical protein
MRAGSGARPELFGAAGLRLVDVRPPRSPMQVIVVEKA